MNDLHYKLYQQNAQRRIQEAQDYRVAQATKNDVKRQGNAFVAAFYRAIRRIFYTPYSEEASRISRVPLRN